MPDHESSCAVHGRGHRTTRNDALAAWSDAGLPLATRAVSVADDGIVVLEVAGEEVVGWHHRVDVLRWALAPGKPLSYQRDVRLLHVGGPFDRSGPWAFSLADPVDHEPCTTRPDPVRRRPRRPEAPSSFRVPYGPGGGRPTVVVAVARLLQRLEGGPDPQAVIVSIGGRNLFTQALIGTHNGVWLEAVSNEFIDDARHRLDDDQHMLLAAFGYLPPSTTVPNHHQHIDRPATSDEVAELLVAPLEVVYGLGSGDEIRVDTFPAVDC